MVYQKKSFEKNLKESRPFLSGKVYFPKTWNLYFALFFTFLKHFYGDKKEFKHNVPYIFFMLHGPLAIV